MMNLSNLGDQIRNRVHSQINDVFQKVGMPKPGGLDAPKTGGFKKPAPPMPGDQNLTPKGDPSGLDLPGPGGQPGAKPVGAPTTPGAPKGAPGKPAPADPNAPKGQVGQAEADKLAAAIKQDPEIKQALDNWGNLSTEEKLAVGQKISQKMGPMLGFNPTTNIVRGDQLAKPGEAGTTGLWSSSGGQSKIQISDHALADPSKFVETMVHEQIHQRDHVLGLPTEPHEHGDHVYDFADMVQKGVFPGAA